MLVGSHHHLRWSPSLSEGGQSNFAFGYFVKCNTKISLCHQPEGTEPTVLFSFPQNVSSWQLVFLVSLYFACGEAKNLSFYRKVLKRSLFYILTSSRFSFSKSCVSTSSLSSPCSISRRMLSILVSVSANASAQARSSFAILSSPGTDCLYRS